MRLMMLIAALMVTQLSAQEIQTAQRVESEVFQEMLDGLLSLDMPSISVSELAQNKEEYIIFDSRNQREYETSHIQGAQWIGYDRLQNSVIKKVPKDQKIVVYCSVGYRSERVTYQLRRRGYENVVNLYGSLFEWVNQGHEIEDSEGKPTRQVHTYNEKRPQFMLNQEDEAGWN